MHIHTYIHIHVYIPTYILIYTHNMVPHPGSTFLPYREHLVEGLMRLFVAAHP